MITVVPTQLLELRVKHRDVNVASQTEPRVVLWVVWPKQSWQTRLETVCSACLTMNSKPPQVKRYFLLWLQKRGKCLCFHLVMFGVLNKEVT